MFFACESNITPTSCDGRAQIKDVLESMISRPVLELDYLYKGDSRLKYLLYLHS